jgi:capsular polysaccharide transport system permease protein
MSATALARRHPWDVQRAVLLALVLREMKARVGGQWVGAIWTLVEPLAHVALLITMFSFIRGAVVAGVEFPVFLATGLIPFFLFQHLAFRLMDGIDANRGLFSYRQVKPLDVLASRSVVETLMNLVVYAVTLGVLGWMGYHVLPAQPLEALGVNALVIFFGTAFGIFCAVISHERPRLRSLLRMLMLPLYFASGVILPVGNLPRQYLDILLWNPLLHLVELSRGTFMAAYTPPEGVNALYPLMFALVTAALAMALYRTNRLRLIAST